MSNFSSPLIKPLNRKETYLGKGDFAALFFWIEIRLYNVVRAHKKKTINSIHGGSAVLNKYGFSAEFIVRNSWECQQKYGTFEHDVFADPSK